MKTYVIQALMAALVALLSGCPTADLGELPAEPGQCRPDPGFFETDIWPNIIDNADPMQSCVAEVGCHSRDNGRSALRFDVPAGTEPVDYTENYNAATRFLNCGTPESSAFLSKPLTGVDAHGGGDLFDLGSPQAMTFLMWFEL